MTNAAGSPKRLTANYASRCGRCPVQIQPGEEILYQRGVGSWHAACPAPAAKTVARPSTSGAEPDVSAAPYVVHERWRADTRSGNASAIAAEIGATRLYELGRQLLPELRARATAPAAEPGVYTIVAAGPWRYQGREENEDCGDMVGPNWHGSFFLRPATAEEAGRDAAERWEAGRPAREFKAEQDRQRGLEAEGRATFLAAAASMVTESDRADRAAFVPTTPGMTDESITLRLGAYGLCSAVESYLSEEERTERKATLMDVWVGREHNHGDWRLSGSYVRAWSWRGQIVVEEHTYIYDWDQPIRVAGCPAFTAHAKAADDVRREREDAERAARYRAAQAAKP